MDMTFGNVWLRRLQSIYINSNIAYISTFVSADVVTWCLDGAHLDASSQLVHDEGGQGLGLHVLHGAGEGGKGRGEGGEGWRGVREGQGEEG